MAGKWDSRNTAKLLELFAVNLDAYAESDSRHRLNRNSLRGS